MEHATNAPALDTLSALIVLREFFDTLLDLHSMTIQELTDLLRF